MKKLPIPFFIILIAIIGANRLSAQKKIEGTYAIRNVKSGLQLRVKDAGSANGTPLVMYNPIEWKCMTWDFRPSEGSSYQLKNVLTGKTVQQKKEGENGTLEEQPLTEKAGSQLYDFEEAGKGRYRIRLKSAGLYLSDEKGEVNAPVTLAKKSDSPAQLWTLHEQHPTI